MRAARKSNYKYGVEAEGLTESYLRERGYDIVGKRYKTPYGEIDLVAAKRDKLLFCEVKGRSKRSRFELISEKQKLRSTQAALFFLSKFTEYADHNMRFDFFSVLGNNIDQHIKGAWEYECF